MAEEIRTGVYVCHCGTNIADKVDVEAVGKFAGTLPGVVVSRDYKYMCSDPGQDLIKKDIKELGLNRVVVASCSPRMHEPTFRRALAAAGLNGYLFEMANIREQVSWVSSNPLQATVKAKSLVSGAVRKVKYNRPLEERYVPVNPNVLIVGGGVAGLEAALKIAGSGNQVYLVEREASLGGKMAKFDKTFPTLDCAACILTPKMVEAGQHEKIKLLTYSEVVQVDGFVGNFQVKVRKKARYVDVNKCTGCGDCEAVCPVNTVDKFNEGLSQRKAVFKEFPQAVPNVYQITKTGTPPCRLTCPAGVNVQGYLALTRQGKFSEALALIREAMPLPAVCGRVCFHPCEGECRRGDIDAPVAINAVKRFLADYEAKNGSAQPASAPASGRKVAIVGAGPAGLAAGYYLSRAGHEVVILEGKAEAGGLLRYGIPEYRLPKEILRREIDQIARSGVNIRTNQWLGRDFTLEKLRREYDAVFLALGTSKEQTLGIPGEDLQGVLSSLKFLESANTRAESVRGRVLVIGGGNAAVDAARTALRLGAQSVEIVYRRTRDAMPAFAEEIREAEKEGVKFRFLTAPLRVVGRGGRVQALECQPRQLGEVDAGGRRKSIPATGPNVLLEAELIIAAVGQKVELPASLVGRVALAAKGTVQVDEYGKTTSDGVFAGGDLVSGPSSMVSAIAAGKEAAGIIDAFVRGEALPGPAPKPRPLPKAASVTEFYKAARHEPAQLEPEKRRGLSAEVTVTLSEEEVLDEAKRCLDCGVCSECQECVKVCQAGAIDHRMQDEEVELEVGNIILATGYEILDPSVGVQWGYGRFPNVLTGLQFERLTNASGPTAGRIVREDGREPEAVAILHCIGSRDKNYKEYCSRVCCMASLKFAHLVKDKTKAKVYEFYIDMRAYGKQYEEFYNRVQDEGVNFIRGKGAEVLEKDGRLVIRAEDTLLGVFREVPVDMVILNTALIPRADADAVARLFTIQRSADGFFLESHPKLEPMKTATDGIYLAGTCQGPKDIPDTVAQAAGAAAEALEKISAGRVRVSPITAYCLEELCSGCKTCIPLCPYNAITFSEEKKVALYNEALCKGCGTCVASCPSGAAHMRNFEEEQMLEIIEGVCAL
ncbi:Dihydroprymidine dehydrogenase domain II, 4Fe-4S cluster [Acididesulfobacillus acetoxydans]|uniref:CoB--CoM heterodisulfide reductase iron-sulfur subunit A n=1 Tax=Acididesulfobacillus acetoxydans TaxID=1561005 RepID=A0A8S0XAR0_9FIRM|nr:NAD(P)-binding protein [Acididesulfobacillus acetoxydans]CAA7600256.1 Dihydroprymidine dehydrogenase domain II, 4Fe-4S cluster [Acididesulfobacillus acetoxydans]CEJ09634.1 CoB--CoM heterodisulfide reductase iron-sulfur subunit A [Acididesulfobacillus acetoxydans]